MESRKPVNLFIPIALAILGIFYLTVWHDLDLIPALGLIAVGLLLYFAFLQVLRHRDKIWFFLMLIVFLIAGLFWLLFDEPLSVKILPAVVLVLWIVSLKMLYSGEMPGDRLLKPDVGKITLLLCFLLFVPTPMFLIFQIGYLPIFHFVLIVAEILTEAKMADLLNTIPAVGIIVTFNAIFGFAYYVIICLMQRRAALRIALLSATALMIITAVTQKVYVTEGEGTDTPESTAVELYTSLYQEIRARDKVDTAPPPPLIIIQKEGKKDETLRPVPVDPSSIGEVPEEMLPQSGKIEPGYDLEAWGPPRKGRESQSDSRRTRR